MVAPRGARPVQVNPTFTPGGITPFSQGSIPQVDRHGRLFIAYEAAVCQSLACDQPTDHDAIIVARSRNGGQTFSNVEAAADFDFPFNADVGTETLTGENFRINSFPQFAIDPRGEQHVRHVGRRPQRPVRRLRQLREEQRRCVRHPLVQRPELVGTRSGRDVC